MKFIANTKDLEKYIGKKIQKNFSIIKGISTDSRSLKKGHIFIAIKGKNFNGNDYVVEALKKGAVIAIVDDKRFIKSKNTKIIYVKNSVLALGKITKNIIKEYNGKVIAITGSNGKTSTTNIISQTIKGSSSTIKNYNNEIGMPLSVINASPKSNSLILEIGASKFNDINYLSKILSPNIGIITNIGNSHLETLKNISGVLQVKSEIINNIKSNGYLIVPSENKQHVDYWKNIRSDIKVFTFGMSRAADFFPSKINFNEKRIRFYINSKHLKANIYIDTFLAGEHNIKNILASCIVHYCLDLNLEKFAMIINSKSLKNTRLTKTKWIRGSTLIDDSYNANPDSAKKSIDLLSCYKKRTFFILGDMLELGRYRKKLHKNIGEYANAKGIDFLIGYGKLTKHAIESFGKNGIFFKKEEELKTYLKENVTSKDVILIKGSRGMKMERFINV